MPEDLPEGYYLENFAYLLRFVTDKYTHLLSVDENTFASSFEALSDNAKKLYVRLSNRKGPYFRVDKLHYTEISDLPAALQTLSQCNLLSFTTPDQESAVDLCSKDELRQVSVCATIARTARKSELAAQILTSDCNPVEYLGLNIVELQGLQHLTVFKLLFFGNFHQDMTEFVMDELIAPFERYKIPDDSCLFRHRHVVELLLELKQLSEMSHELLEIDGDGHQLLQLADLMPDRPGESMLAWRFDRINNRIGRQLERLGRENDALKIYQRSVAAPSRERQARILVKQGHHQDAIAICEAIAAAPLDEDELEFAQKFGARIAEKHDLELSSSISFQRSTLSQQSISMLRIDESIELCAVQHFNSLGFKTYYVENTLMPGLFGLAFWDIIFAPVPDAFFHPFQRGPADLYTADFAVHRREMIENRLLEIEQNGLSGIVVTRFEEKFGIANQFVSWTHLSRELLELALLRIPTEHYLKIFERLLTDLRNNSNGFPDLVLFGQADYKLVEIKGPGDKLQTNQTRWLRYFNLHGIPAEVVNVDYKT